MTATVSTRRDDLQVHPATITSTPGRLLRAIAIAMLLALSSVAYAAAQDASPEATPSAEPTPSPSMPRLELDLEELNDSGISGTVTLYDAGDDRTIVEFDVEGAGGNHPAHIHEGTCGDLNPEPWQNLDNVDEEGQSMTVVDVGLDDLLADDYAIDMHLAPDELGTLIACANIDGEPESPAGATPAASPTASPESTPESPAVGGTRATETPPEPGTAVTATEVPGQGGPSTTEPASGDGTSGAGVAAAPAEAEPPTTAPTTTVPVGGDGTAGISGKGEPVDTSTLPQQAGVGAMLEWPEGPALATMWASAAAGIILGAGGWIVRRGEHRTRTTPSRWNRIGI